MKKLLCLIFLCSSAYGSFLFEPYGGTTFSGTLEESNTDALFTGASFGAKLGVQYTYFFAGFDYRIGRFSVDAKEDDTTLEDDTLNNEQYFLFVGYEFPMWFRAWGGLALGGYASSNDRKFREGNGALVGLGYKGLPWVSVNLEYVTWGYDKVDPGSDSDLKGQHFLFSLSLPINF